MESYTISRSNEALATAATETILQLVTGSTRRAKVTEVFIGFDGTSSTQEPVDVELLRQSSAGTGSAITPAPDDPQSPAAIATAQGQFSAEPTAGTVLRRWMVHPQGDRMHVQLPLGREVRMNVSERIGLRVTTASGVTPNCSADITFEE